MGCASSSSNAPLTPLAYARLHRALPTLPRAELVTLPFLHSARPAHYPAAKGRVRAVGGGRRAFRFEAQAPLPPPQEPSPFVLPERALFLEEVGAEEARELAKLNYGLVFLKLLLMQLHTELREESCSLAGARERVRELALVSLPTVSLLHRADPPPAFSILDKFQPLTEHGLVAAEPAGIYKRGVALIQATLRAVAGFKHAKAISEALLLLRCDIALLEGFSLLAFEEKQLLAELLYRPRELALAAGGDGGALPPLALRTARRLARALLTEKQLSAAGDLQTLRRARRLLRQILLSASPHYFSALEPPSHGKPASPATRARFRDHLLHLLNTTDFRILPLLPLPGEPEPSALAVGPRIVLNAALPLGLLVPALLRQVLALHYHDSAASSSSAKQLPIDERWVRCTFHMSVELWEEVTQAREIQDALASLASWQDESLFKLVYGAALLKLQGPPTRRVSSLLACSADLDRSQLYAEKPSPPSHPQADHERAEEEEADPQAQASAACQPVSERSD